MKPDFTRATWHNEPAIHTVTDSDVRITTDPGTDFWQRTYYGFRNTNAHTLLWDEGENITLTVRVQFDYRSLFDQCGVAWSPTTVTPTGQPWTSHRAIRSGTGSAAAARTF